MDNQYLTIQKIDHREISSYWNSIDNKFKGDYSVNYLMGKNHEQIAKHRFGKDLLFILENLPEERERFLDLGCGTGNYLEKLSKYFTYCDGVDISKYSCNIARKRFSHEKKIKIYCQDVILFKLNKEYDLVNISEVLMYLNDDEVMKVLTNINKNLKKNGKLILRESVAKIKSIYLGKNSHQTIRRTINHLKQLFHTSGFDIETVSQNLDYNYAWIITLSLYLFPFLLKNNKFVFFYLNNTIIRFLFLNIPLKILMLFKKNFILQYYFVLQKR